MSEQVIDERLAGVPETHRDLVARILQAEQLVVHTQFVSAPELIGMYGARAQVILLERPDVGSYIRIGVLDPRGTNIHEEPWAVPIFQRLANSGSLGENSRLVLGVWGVLKRAGLTQSDDVWR